MDCYNLAKIDVDPDNPNYVSDNGVLYTKGYEVLYIYPIGRPDKSYQVHEGCSEIKTMAFEDNRYLEEIDLKGVKKIGNYAFGNADSLAKVTFDPEVESLDLSGVELLGVTSGASTPESFFRAAVERLRGRR